MPSLLLRVVVLLSTVIILAPGGDAAQSKAEAGASSTQSKSDEASQKTSATDSLAMPHFDSGAPRWYPPDLSPSDADWIQLTSGEWLKGTIKGIRRTGVDFDSDKLKTVRLKLKDVLQLRSSDINTFVFTNRRIVVGIGQITEDQVLIQTTAGEQSFPRSDLVSLVVGDRDELKLWTGSATVGLSVTSGNTEQTTGNAQASLRRDGAFLRLRADYYGHFSQTSGVTKIENQQVVFQSELFIYDKLFLIPARFDYYSNEFANIEMRVEPGMGLGYQFLDQSPLAVQLITGILYQRVEYVSTPVNQSPIFQSPAILVGTTVNYDLTSFVTLNLNYTATLALLNTSHLNQQAILKLDIDVMKYVKLNSTLNWTRIGDPVAKSTGVVPKRDDVILTFGIGLSF